MVVIPNGLNFKKAVWEGRTNDAEVSMIFMKKKFAEKYHVSPLEFEKMDLKDIILFNMTDDLLDEKYKVDNPGV